MQRAFDELLDDDSAVSRLPTGDSFEEPARDQKLVLLVDDDAESRALLRTAGELALEDPSIARTARDLF